MRAGTIVLGVALGVGAHAGARAEARPRPGRVVRVERVPAGLRGMPRFCDVSSDLTGYCIGPRAPVVGERIDLLDPARAVAVLRVREVTAVPGSCNIEQVWMIRSVVESGDLSGAQGQTLGVIDVPLDPRTAHLVSVDRSPSGHPWGTDQIWAVDANGDDTPDVEFARFPCDDSGTYATRPDGQCVEVWVARRGRPLARIRRDRVRSCL